VAAAEEERFRRVKHWAGFPAQAIGYCLAEAGIEPAALDHVAVNSDPNANMLRRLGHVALSRPDPRLLFDRLRNRKRRASTAAELARLSGAPFRGEVHAVEHHLAHLASCFLVSPFTRAATVSVDGFGDFASAAWGVGEGGEVDIQSRVYFPHSLGIFYQAITQYLGFPHYGDEYKVMGLAPYGRPTRLAAMREIVRLHADGSYALNLRYFRHHREHVAYSWTGGAPHVGDLFSPALEELLGPRRHRDTPLDDAHRDIAASAQAMYEEAFFNILMALHDRTGLTDLAIAGGCGMNSVANGKVRRKTPFRRLYVQSAAGDAGGAIGAAMVVSQRGGSARAFVMEHAYWGPQFDASAVAGLLADRQEDIAEADCTVETIASESELCRRTAAAIADGQVVGWFQGRMEWGPRALGNRSILGDPRREDMKDILNLKIKRRESFRPFAPSVLENHVADWFEEDDAVPFMMQVFQIRAEKRPRIPAVTHVDGSGRLQTVSARTNAVYYALIDTFRELTGVPMVLNTSFNENEPVVCTPGEALECFLRTKMDLLVIGRVMIRRTGSSDVAA
jgi:carbamoyltransferase